MALLLEAKNIRKYFGHIKAVDDVDFSVDNNEVVGLVGDNGAGKSTIAKILMGVSYPDSGEFYFNGMRIEKLSIEKARELGIEMVYQREALCDIHTIWRNIFMAREIARFGGFIDIKKSKSESMRLLREIGFAGDITPDSPVTQLSGGERKGVAIARAMHFKKKLLILDEPLVALSVRECDKVMDFVLAIKEKGTSSILISHNLFQLYPVVDRLVVLERGKKIGDFKKDHVSVDELKGIVSRGKRLPNDGSNVS
jgi:simple sugar transport system ATP-binding protein